MIISENTKEKITSPNAAARIMTTILQTESEIDKDKEHFWVIGLNTQNIIKYIELVSLGCLNKNLVHPREIYRLAISQGVSSIIGIHNHPSGSVEESNEDVALTTQLIEAGKILGIELLDHIIIGGNEPDNFKSLKIQVK